MSESPGSPAPAAPASPAAPAPAALVAPAAPAPASPVDPASAPASAPAPAPAEDPHPDPRREECFDQIHSADTRERLLSTREGTREGGDRLAEAVELMTRIRRDGQWEAEQTHASLLPYLLEESWELVDAVADGDRDELVSELGDLLLQVLFHAAIGAERDDRPFDVHDVAGALLDKLRRRAPYWFTDDDDADADTAASDDDAASSAAVAAEGPGDAESGTSSASPTGTGSDTLTSTSTSTSTSTGTPTGRRAPAHLDSAEQDRLWQEAKAAELRAAERSGRPPRGVVDGISWDQPALALGQKVLGRARSAGIPDDLVPEEMRIVRVDPAGVFHDSGSAEVGYRQVVRRFADRIRKAELRLAVPAAEATPADWRAAWA